MPSREAKRRELRTAIVISLGLAAVMFLFVMVAKKLHCRAWLITRQPFARRPFCLSTAASAKNRS
jgi:hypothetical protein